MLFPAKINATFVNSTSYNAGSTINIKSKSTNVIDIYPLFLHRGSGGQVAMVLALAAPCGTMCWIVDSSPIAAQSCSSTHHQGYQSSMENFHLLCQMPPR